ncbi:MAG: amidohydrolase family protein [Opitutae bacterium]|nr:amidohydrolase family protein [Opitutae bacterium]
MKLPRLLLPLGLVCAATLFAAEPAKTESAPAITIVRAARLVDPAAGKVLIDQAVVIEGDKVKSVGSAADVLKSLPAGAKVIDLGDVTLLPGLIDCHTHITGQPENFYEDLFRRSPIDEATVSHIYAKRTLLAGFTTIRNVGADNYTDLALRNAINRGALPGPRILASGPALSATGGHGDLNRMSPYVHIDGINGIADGVDAVRKKVRDDVKYGADVIKILATAGVLSEEESVGLPQYTLEEMKTAVEEAAVWGKKVAAHAHGTEGIKLAIRAGVASVEHASFIDDEGIKLAKEHGTYLVPDIYNDDYILDAYAKMGYPENIIAKERLVGRTQRENFQKAVKAGCKIAYGTDAGVYPHGWNGKQMIHMVRWGMTPMQAVQSATVNAADLLGQNGKIGQLAPGFFADLIAIKGDPLADQSLFEKVDFVMKAGVIYKNHLTADPVKQFE